MNYEDRWPLERLLNADPEWLRSIWVGHWLGRTDLAQPVDPNRLKAKAWKWRFATTPGIIVPWHWLRGDQFVQLASTW